MKWTLILLMVSVVAVMVSAVNQDDLDGENELFGGTAAEEQDASNAVEDNSNEDDPQQQQDDSADIDDTVGVRVVRSAQQANNEGTRQPGNRRQQGGRTRNPDRERNGGQRNVQQRNNGERKACRYNKAAWSECDTATNQRTRSLTLKKGDSSCEQTKTITKKCKKAGGNGGAGRRNRN